MTKDRIAAIIALLLCVAFVIGLVVEVTNFSGTLDQKNIEIQSLKSLMEDKNQEIGQLQDKAASDATIIASQNGTITNLQSQVESSSSQIDSLETQLREMQDRLDDSYSQISYLNSSVATLRKEVDRLTGIIKAMNKSSNPETLIFHVCEKGEEYTWGRIPNVNYTYNQILQLTNSTYEVLLLPEYRGNLNWTETFAWLRKNFSGIPIALSIFEGGSNDYPNMQLTVSQISEAVTALSVRALRIGEITSWHIEHNLAFPTDYIQDILNFARSYNLKVLWSEWKVGDNVFRQVKNYTDGFEGIVTVAFQTNSGDLEPANGFELVSNLFPHWGGSIQSWYWDTRKLGNETAMPISLLVQHTLEASNLGAEVLQFEPYWYFFDNGEPNENLRILMATLA